MYRGNPSPRGDKREAYTVTPSGKQPSVLPSGVAASEGSEIDQEAAGELSRARPSAKIKAVDGGRAQTVWTNSPSVAVLYGPASHNRERPINGIRPQQKVCDPNFPLIQITRDKPLLCMKNQVTFGIMNERHFRRHVES